MTGLVPSIIIPAHQEAECIGDLLTSLEPLAADVEVVVVCNGCTDGTAEVARRVAPWATVLDVPLGSKPAALQLGDVTATSFPRLYLDADIRLAPQSVNHLLGALSPDSPLLAAAGTPVHDVSGVGLVVRSYHRLWAELTSRHAGLQGTGAMAVTAAGRSRFDSWPSLIGDDYFLDGLFQSHEKARIPDAPASHPWAPGLLDCISRKARVYQGNREVREAGLRSDHREGGGGSAQAALSILRRRPSAAVDLPAFLLITLSSRTLSWWRRRRGTSGVWFRDRGRVAAS